MTLNEHWGEYKGYKVHYGKSEVSDKTFFWCAVWHPEQKWLHVHRELGDQLNKVKKACQEWIEANPL